MLLTFKTSNSVKKYVCVCHPLDGSEPEAGVEAEEWNDSGSSTETDSHGTELFWLDYQADSGTITSFLVHKVNAHPFDCCFLLDLLNVVLIIGLGNYATGPSMNIKQTLHVLCVHSMSDPCQKIHDLLI